MHVFIDSTCRETGCSPFVNISHMQFFGQYIIIQNILQNTVEIICTENVYFDEDEKTCGKKI
jgi:hypothetical protein